MYVCVCMHVCMHACMCVCACMHACMYVCMHAHIMYARKGLCIWMYSHVCKGAHVCTHARIHARTHIYTHAYVCRYVLMLLSIDPFWIYIFGTHAQMWFPGHLSHAKLSTTGVWPHSARLLLQQTIPGVWPSLWPVYFHGRCIWFGTYLQE